MVVRKKYDIQELEKIASELRVDIVSMLAKAGSGHPGGSLSMVEIITALFFNIMNIDPSNLLWEERDRFHLSKGHACPALYATLSRLGYFPQEELCNLRQLGCLLQGHPHPRTPGVEVASGSLGQGLSIANGMALAARLDKKKTNVYVVVGDGELQEGQVWEAAMFAAHYALENLVAIVDYNGIQIDGKVADIMNIEPLHEKWNAFGFHVSSVDGHDMAQIISTVESIKQIKNKPKVIIAHTVKGKGVSFMEHNADFHGRSPDNNETSQALDELKGVE